MAQQIINIGAAPDDDTGDDLRTGGGKINDNFTELYASVSAAGASWKTPVRVATTTTKVLATEVENGDTIDGVVLATGDRVLLKDQASPAENGIYVVAVSGAPARAVDADSSAELVNAAVLVSEGTANADKLFVCTTNATITVDTSPLVWADFTPGGGALPVGGTTGQVLTKQSGTDGDADWETPSGGGSGILDANWFNVVTYGATGDGSTDDTVAIQGAIDACAAAGGGTVFFPVPSVYYKVAGALQDVSGANAQLTMPAIKYADDGTSGAQVTIELRGEKVPPTVVSVIGAWPAPDDVSVIRSTLASGTGACIGGYGPSGSASNFTNMRLVMRNLVMQMPADPTNTAVNASRIAQFESENLLIHCGEFYVASVAAQTTTTSYGLKLPERYNGAFVRVRSTNVIGFYNGFSMGEHANMDDALAWACTNAFTVATQDHAINAGRLCIHHCKNGIVATGAAYLSVAQFNIEHAASGTWTPTYDVSDASNHLRGGLKWHIILAGTGADKGFLSTGAVYFKRERLQRLANVFGLTEGATVTVDCNQCDTFDWPITGNRTFANPTNPYDGQVINVLIRQDGTGGRTWTLGSKFKFPGGAPALSTGSAARDLVSCQYHATVDIWACSIIKALS